MQFDELSLSVTRGFSTRDIAKQSGCCQATVRYWLRKYNLRTKAMYKEIPPIKCRLCEREHKDKRRRRCNSCNTRVRRMRMKLAAISFLGGKCLRCGWHGLPAGFDFHHIGGIKEFNIGNVSNKSWDCIKIELQKCELLCKCCHAIHHSKHEEARLMEEVSSYSGRLLDNAEVAELVKALV